MKVLRVVRFLRPLRLIQKNPGLKIAVQSLINALPEIFNLMIICLSCLSIFSILGVNFYKGSFYSCSVANIPIEARPLINTYWDCLDYGGEWVNADANYDNFL
jgi:hypothetical protein